MRHPAISIRQLWAAAIVLGVKDVENRDWRLPAVFTGVPVIIHAGRTVSCSRTDLLDLAGQDAPRLALALDANPDAARTGGIVGAAVFEGCGADASRSRWAESGRVHWIVREAWPLPFHPLRGQLKIFMADYPHPIRPS